MNILAQIVAHKHLEIKSLYEKYDLNTLRSQTPLSTEKPLFYQSLAESAHTREPFFIAEFKRRSPSEGWINAKANLPSQVRAYAQAGARAISVLTDTRFFGGAYEDLKVASQTISSLPERPLLLQKDFILDPIQLYLAKQAGADLILLIAAILSAEQLMALQQLAESIGLGVLVEVHDMAEYQKIQHLPFPVLGVNNRDLKTFRTALNRVNTFRAVAETRFIIAESGIKNAMDFQMVRDADGFLIGTGLMQEADIHQKTFKTHFHTQGKKLFKACGIRTPDVFQDGLADFLGVNFSPLSKRRPTVDFLQKISAFRPFPGFKTSEAVAVFYQNPLSEIKEILEHYPFKTIQVYAEEHSPEQVRGFKQKVILAAKIRQEKDLEQLEAYAADVDCFILDGPLPGSGEPIGIRIPTDFPYPFLLAGGLHAQNLDQISAYQHCIGVDIASGIETNQVVDVEKLHKIKEKLAQIMHFSEISNI